jgi:uncharacterized membrane protein YoaK (UPF0700 family)
MSPPAKLQRTLMFLLSLIAGYVDACTFLALFGLFVAQMTGSFVIVGTEPVVQEAGFLMKALAIPVFVIAAAATTILVSVMRPTNQSAWAWVLGLEAVLLIAFLLIGLANSPFGDPDQPAALMAGFCGLAAMGVQSASVRLLAKHLPSTNVMTTNTTQFAIDATYLLLARFRARSADKALPGYEIGSARQRFAGTVRVMIGFVVGVVLGAPAFRVFGFICMAPIVGILLCLVIAMSREDLAAD